MYKSNRHSCYDLQYHLVVVTKYRKKVLNGPLGDRLIQLTRNLFEEKWGLTVNEINTDKDYIHILFEAGPEIQLSKLINNYKTVTSRLIRKEFKDYLDTVYFKPVFWSGSYFIGSMSERTTDVVKAYIQNQGQ